MMVMKIRRRRWHRHRYLLTGATAVPSPFDTWIAESLASDDADHFYQQPEVESEKRGAWKIRGKVLVAEDDRDTREVIAFYLNSLGYQVITASCGRTALELVRQDLPDLLLTDIQMPDLDGLELIRQLRADPSLAGMPIVAITAYGAEKIGKAIAAGADACLAKPLDLARLAQNVEGLLR